MKSHPGMALPATVLVLAGACMITPPSRAATSAAPEENSSRIAEIMQRLRDVRRFEAVSIAPDGKTVAWTVTEQPHGDVKPASSGNGKPGQILQVARADGTAVRAVTIPQSVKSCRYSNLQWSPDSRTLAFLSNCNHSAGKDEQFDVYEVGASEVAARRISHLQGFINQLEWKPNGADLSFLYVEGDVHPVSAVSATKALVGVIGETGVERQRIAVLPANGGEVRQITPTSLFVYEYDWSSTGDQLAYVAALPPGRDNWWLAKLYTQSPDGAPKVELDPATVSGPLHGLQIALRAVG